MVRRSKDYFQKYGVDPSYRQPDNLVKFLSPRRKILSRKITGLTSKTQKKLREQISYARFLSLIPVK